ncbi:MAG: DUF2332 domain-containing protein [Anaerolineae bacterium]|nr:DUF2332 domain-containing protein [Anaerolineae bacterium]
MIPDGLSSRNGLDRLALWFENFASHEVNSTSPLYGRLTHGVAQHEDLLELASHATREPIPNMLFGAVHYLLLKGAAHPLAAYYPSVSGADTRTDDPLPALRDFCRQYRAEIIHLLQTRRVQTNEVNRCAVLLPAFGLVARQEPGRKLALIEIGASAGLNLLWDYYRYDYGAGRKVGPADAALALTNEPRGAQFPPIPAALPIVCDRLGLDLNPVDLRDEDAVLWLRALIWPEHAQRADRLQQALAIAQAYLPEVRSGDALDLLPDALNHSDEDCAVCVYHSFVINQFSEEARQRLTDLLAEGSQQRPIYRLSIEWMHSPRPQLELRTYRGGAEVDHAILAACDGHATWMEWLGPA